MDFDTQSQTILEALDLAHRWQVHYVAWTEQGGGAEDWHFKGIRGGKAAIERASLSLGGHVPRGPPRPPFQRRAILTELFA